MGNYPSVDIIENCKSLSESAESFQFLESKGLHVLSAIEFHPTLETSLAKSALEAQADLETGDGTIKSLVDVDAVKAILDWIT
jgi:hypothetical protein